MQTEHEYYIAKVLYITVLYIVRVLYFTVLYIVRVLYFTVLYIVRVLYFTVLYIVRVLYFTVLYIVRVLYFTVLYIVRVLYFTVFSFTDSNFFLSLLNYVELLSCFFLVQGLLVQGTHSRLHILGLVQGLGEHHPILREETNSTLGVVQSHHTPQVKGEVPPILDVCDNGHAYLILHCFTSLIFILIL